MILKPIQFLYHFASSTKFFLYEKNIFKKVSLSVPVISIGNITFGGAGKTPHIEFLANELSKKYKIVIVCRSYKASLKNPERVNLKLKKCAALFGDEACMLQMKLPNCIVWSGPSKSQTAQAAMADSPELILVDDGFSHVALKRNFDLLLFPADFSLDELTRESIESIKRANAIIITKANMSDAKKTDELKSLLLIHAPYLANAIYTSEAINEIIQGEIFAFCGLAKPEGFFASISDLVEKKSFPDHHQYTDSDQNDLYNRYLELRKSYPNLEVVTSEKDFVKINHEKLKSILKKVVLKINMSQKNQEGLIGQIRSVL